MRPAETLHGCREIPPCRDIEFYTALDVTLSVHCPRPCPQSPPPLTLLTAAVVTVTVTVTVTALAHRRLPLSASLSGQWGSFLSGQTHVAAGLQMWSVVALHRRSPFTAHRPPLAVTAGYRLFSVHSPCVHCSF